MTDPFLAAARTVFDDTLTGIRAAIEGASPAQLNAKPGGNDTNSITVLAVHAMRSTRAWLSFVRSFPAPPRVRDEEFVATTPDAASLLALVAVLERDCVALLEPEATIDWAEVRPISSGEMVTTAWALMHAIEHLREHMGQIALTRQILDHSA
jgi:uncharacterized damage-inducible protein DinB